MINIEGVVLYKLLETKSLDAFADLKACFFTGAYSPIYRIIHKFYVKHGYVPSFEELETVTKDALHKNSILTLQTIEVPDVDIELAVSALIDQYMQTEALEALDTYLDNITYYDATEIKEQLGSILLELDRKLSTDETIVTADKVTVFPKPEDAKRSHVATGISNYWDAELGGVCREEFILLGGKRGAGKSMVCANMTTASYEAGKVAPYFTIEMNADETFKRIMSILSGVSFSKIRKQTCSLEEIDKMAKVRCDMFLDGDKVYEKFKEHNDPHKMEQELVSTCKVKPDNQIIMIDDRELSVTQIDLKLQKLMAEHGEKIELVVVDYLNQVTLAGNANDMYDWKDQIAVSKQLKNLARKYDITIVSPYQIDDSGATRFARGILDAADMAIILDAATVPDSILFKCTKSRSTDDEFVFRTVIDWDTLRIDPTEVEAMPEEQESEEADDRENHTKTRIGKAKGAQEDI